MSEAIGTREFAENMVCRWPRCPSGVGKVKFQIVTKIGKDHLGIFPRMQFHPLDISEGKSDIEREQSEADVDFAWLCPWLPDA